MANSSLVIVKTLVDARNNFLGPAAFKYQKPDKKPDFDGIKEFDQKPAYLLLMLERRSFGSSSSFTSKALVIALR